MAGIFRTVKRFVWPQGKRRWLKRGAIFLVLFGIMNVAAVETTSQSWFCNSCHIMNPYYSTWQHGSHKDVACVSCHIPPGAENLIFAKLNGAGQVVDDLLARTNTKPSAVVSDASCTRAGCHNVETVRAKKIEKPTYKFDHGKHLGRQYRGINIHCTTCHAHIKSDKHFDVSPTTCITCHMHGPEAAPGKTTTLVDWAKPEASTQAVQKAEVITPAEPAPAAAADAKASGEKVAPRDCKGCHNPPEKEINYHGLRVLHSEYLQYGARCESCHSGVTENSRPVRDEQCFGCHEFGMERLGSVEQTHKIHSDAGHHKVECFNCHGMSRHGPEAQKVDADQLVCQSCHKGQHAIQQRNYKRDEDVTVASMANGLLSPGAPAVSPMFLAHVACSGCHIKTTAERNRPGSGATVTLADAKACDNCHKPGASEQVPLWQRNTKALYEGVSKMLPVEDRTLDDRQQKLVADARQLLDLVRVDGSWGVHNPRYTQRLLEQAQKDLIDVGAAPGPTTAPSSPAASAAEPRP
jgi:nitrate/TMAO reductase-like tetraheme cytochrome c subunit